MNSKQVAIYRQWYKTEKWLSKCQYYHCSWPWRTIKVTHLIC